MFIMEEFMERKILRGLKVSDFIHPEELVAKANALNNPMVRKYLDSTLVGFLLCFF